MAEKIHLSFDDICQDITKLGHDILCSNQKYDAILTISGGGLIPSRLLRTYVNIPIYSVGISFYINDKMQERPIIFQWLREEEINFLKTRKVLIVDELSDTSGTLNLLVNKLVDDGFQPHNIGIALLYDKIKKKKYSPVMDNFQYGENLFVSKRIEDKWVVFPWDSFHKS